MDPTLRVGFFVGVQLTEALCISCVCFGSDVERGFAVRTSPSISFTFSPSLLVDTEGKGKEDEGGIVMGNLQVLQLTSPMMMVPV